MTYREIAREYTPFIAEKYWKDEKEKERAEWQLSIQSILDEVMKDEIQH